MTYLQFHLVFIVPVLLVLLYSVRSAVSVLGPRARWTLPLICLIAVAYTTPWDNYLVYRGVWGYGADRVLGTIGYVPVEEYAFFILQPLLVGAWAYRLLMAASRGRAMRSAAPAGDAHPGGVVALNGKAARPAATWVGSALLVLCATFGALLLGTERGLYAGLILVWACPVLAGQWFLIGHDVIRSPRTFARMVVPPTLYLWAADRAAIGLGIWHISPRYTSGLHIVGLPIEEALFFLVTNLLVVLGILLFLRPGSLPLPDASSPRAAEASLSLRTL
jgi:lycopene beta-cyclase